MQRAVGEYELHIRAASTSLIPGTELESTNLRHEVRLPHVAAGSFGNELAFTTKIPSLARALWKGSIVFKNEGLIIPSFEKFNFFNSSSTSPLYLK